MTEFEPRDTRRPTRHLEGLDDRNCLLRVKLQADLGPIGSVSATVMIPQAPTGTPTEDADYWKESSKVINNVMNGLPNLGTIAEGKQCWIYNYYGRWVVLIPEC
jgi:hypothetical protein